MSEKEPKICRNPFWDLFHFLSPLVKLQTVIGLFFFFHPPHVSFNFYGVTRSFTRLSANTEKVLSYLCYSENVNRKIFFLKIASWGGGAQVLKKLFKRNRLIIMIIFIIDKISTGEFVIVIDPLR